MNCDYCHMYGTYADVKAHIKAIHKCEEFNFKQKLILFYFIRSGRVHKLTKDNLARTPNSAGNYKLYDKNRKPVYVGTTAGNVGAKWGKNEDQRYRYGLRH